MHQSCVSIHGLLGDVHRIVNRWICTLGAALQPGIVLLSLQQLSLSSLRFIETAVQQLFATCRQLTILSALELARCVLPEDRSDVKFGHVKKLQVYDCVTHSYDAISPGPLLDAVQQSQVQLLEADAHMGKFGLAACLAKLQSSALCVRRLTMSVLEQARHEVDHFNAQMDGAVYVGQLDERMTGVWRESNDMSF